MRFLMTVNGGGRPSDEQLYADMGRFVEELTRAGVLLATGGLDRGTHVTASGGNITLTDGPFTESKEVIVSFALLEVRSQDEALELARRFWKLVGDGEGDIRQVFGPEGLWLLRPRLVVPGRCTARSRRCGGWSRRGSSRAWPGCSVTSAWPRNWRRMPWSPPWNSGRPRASRRTQAAGSC
ncbi:MAG TPA: YciI family protein [Streptosporangiaceae bacterium]|nr:YciI family protein [Streptosporangiaceae bacterium]